jgi:hypothetical protein
VYCKNANETVIFSLMTVFLPPTAMLPRVIAFVIEKHYFGLQSPILVVSWDRIYYFLNIFAIKFIKKLAFLTQNKAKICKILIITLVFEKNANFLPKIVKNCRKL